MHRLKSPLGPLILCATAVSGFTACTNSSSQLSLVEGDERLCYVTPVAGSGCELVFAAQGDGDCSLSGKLFRAVEDDLPLPVDLTLLRYGALGESMVVTEYMNLALGEGDERFRVEGLDAGLWVVSARTASSSGAFWGRSEPTILDPETTASEVSVELRSYGVDLEITGIPAALRNQVAMTFEWTSTDRVQGEALEFLDPPQQSEYLGHSGSVRDGFQVFGVLTPVPETWLAYDQGASPPLGPNDEPILDTESDPFGMGKSLRSWVSLCPEGHASVGVGGPGHVMATLHGVPGLWPTQVVTFDLTSEEPLGRRVLELDLSADYGDEVPRSVAAADCK